MVSAAKRRVDDAATDADNGDREVLIAEIVTHELERPVEREGRNGVGKGLAALEREAGADADHTLLGDADIQEALGKLLAELVHAASRGDVGNADEDVFVPWPHLVRRR